MILPRVILNYSCCCCCCGSGSGRDEMLCSPLVHFFFFFSSFHFLFRSATVSRRERAAVHCFVRVCRSMRFRVSWRIQNRRKSKKSKGTKTIRCRCTGGWETVKLLFDISAMIYESSAWRIFQFGSGFSTRWRGAPFKRQSWRSPAKKVSFGFFGVCGVCGVCVGGDRKKNGEEKFRVDEMLWDNAIWDRGHYF